jgi:tRNA-(ms[2]io[6]A)-hydroxylase
MVSEANHYTLFLGYARKYMDRKTVDEKWKSLLAFEAEMMKSRGTKATVHG